MSTNFVPFSEHPNFTDRIAKSIYNFSESKELENCPCENFRQCKWVTNWGKLINKLNATNPLRNKTSELARKQVCDPINRKVKCCDLDNQNLDENEEILWQNNFSVQVKYFFQVSDFFHAPIFLPQQLMSYQM